MMTDDASYSIQYKVYNIQYTREIKPRIAIAKEAFNGKKTVLIIKLYFNFLLPKC
jgi:hypothetical protein